LLLSCRIKDSSFLVLVMLLWWFLEHFRKMFGEMCERL
jgi:hypothetical protein